MGIEFELKYRATPEQLEQARQALEGQEQHFFMHTQYYDTPTGALSARHYTLRCRTENGRQICTLKYPVAGAGTGEVDTECDTLDSAIPVLIQKSGLPDIGELLKEKPVPVCGARFTRTAKTVQWEGAVLEVALDEGILTGGGRELPLCELEVELKKGSVEAACSCGAFLQKTCALEPEKKSKFRRALDLVREGV